MGLGWVGRIIGYGYCYLIHLSIFFLLFLFSFYIIHLWLEGNAHRRVGQVSVGKQSMYACTYRTVLSRTGSYLILLMPSLLLFINQSIN